MEPIQDLIPVVAPVVVIIGRNKITRSGPIPSRDLREEMLAMQPNLFVRLPKLRQPKPEDHGAERSSVETDFEG